MTWLIIRVGAVLLPVIVLGWQVFALERDLADHTVWRVPVVGFDPRDPIRGHYVRFRYDWPLSSSDIERCNASLPDCRLCLVGEQPAILSATVVVQESSPDHCDALLLVNPVEGRDESSLLSGQRFYLDEALAKTADDALRQQPDSVAEMEIAVTRSGQVRALQLHLGGQPLTRSK